MIQQTPFTMAVMCVVLVRVQDEFNYDDLTGASPLERPPNSPLPPKRVISDIISFKRVALDAPDGMPLVRTQQAGQIGRHTYVHAHKQTDSWADRQIG